MTRIVYIAGSGRSGSTILGSTLGEVPSAVFGGEVHWVWERGVQQNVPCACQQPFSDCVFWSQVFNGAFDEVNLDQLAADMWWLLFPQHFHHVWLACRALQGKPTPFMTPRSRRLVAWAPVVRTLYQRIQDEAGAEVIIDSSKNPFYGYYLGCLPGVELTLVQLTRDVRGVVHSRSKPKPDPVSGKPLPVTPPWRVLAAWSFWNSITPVVGRRFPYLSVTYEHFVHQPKEVIGRIVEAAGLSPTGLPISGERTVHLSPDHSFSGNPARYNKGAVALRHDQKWHAKMPAATRLMVTVLALPLLLAYGYKVRPS